MEEIRPAGDLAGDRSLALCAEAKAGSGSEQGGVFRSKSASSLRRLESPGAVSGADAIFPNPSMITNPNISWLPETTG
jgi:hypothetical protein